MHGKSKKTFTTASAPSGADLSEDDRKIAEEYDKLMFQRIADAEQLMYYAGFRDGIRAARLFHEIEEKPLSE